MTATETEQRLQPAHLCCAHSTCPIRCHPQLMAPRFPGAPDITRLQSRVRDLAVPVVVTPALNNDDAAAHGHVRRLSKPGGGARRVTREGRTALLAFGTVPYPRQQARTAGRSAAAFRPLAPVVFASQCCSPLEWTIRGSETGTRGLSYLVLRSQSTSSEVRRDVLAA